MPEIQKTTLIDTKPGIRRDGTNLDGDNYADGQWVRFQRGRPKKIGGYSRIADSLTGIVRENLVWTRGDQINIFSFSGSKIELVQVDKNGGGSSVTDLTPIADFTANADYLWSVDTMFDDAAGSEKTLILAVPVKMIGNIDDLNPYPLYVGPADGSSAFVKVTDANATASGGVFVCNPYAVLYGTDGNVTWSNANEPKNYTTGDAGSDRVTGSKIVHGESIRSGSGAAGLLWSLDSVIRMEYVGGQVIFRFSKIGESSILAKNSVIEYDGVFYWVGVDRFYATDGSKINEIPNVMNHNWFFDNLNYEHSNKIWAMKIPKYGEIWWFYPRGENTECSHAIILNVREQTWYDCELSRSAGASSKVFRFPIMSSPIESDKRRLNITITSGSFVTSDEVIGATSGATGVVIINDAGILTLSLNSQMEFIAGETLTNLTHAGSASVDSYEYLYSTYTHEKGFNAVEDTESAIESYFTTADFGLPANAGVNRQTNFIRIEPDFIQSGTLTMDVLSHRYANSEETNDGPFLLTEGLEYLDPRVQRRHLQLKFTSNELNGFYEMGKTILWTEAGDLRP